MPLLFLASCSQSDEPIPELVMNEKTLFMYLPWSSNLTSYFYQNIKGVSGFSRLAIGMSEYSDIFAK